MPPLVVVGVLIGAASLFANVVWNCNGCGWDPHTVPWYQALLVAGVPFVIAPLGVLSLLGRAVWLRSRSALLEFGGASVGLALPWLYYLVILLHGF
jgi:hypothetical protein